MPILRKRRISRGLAAEEGQGAKSSMHRKQGSVHSFLGSRGYSSAAGYQCSSNSRIFSRGMATVTVLRFSGGWRNEPLTHWLKALLPGP